MTIEQLPSGNYRISEMKNGKRYRVTLDHKPKRLEAELLIEDKMTAEGLKMALKGTLCEYANKYLSKCEKDDLSPSTLRSYRSIIRNTSQKYLDYPFADFTNDLFKKMVREYQNSTSGTKQSHISGNRSAKSVSNFAGFYKAVFRSYRPSLDISIELPKRIKKKPYSPTSKDVEAILQYVKGTEFSIPYQLSVLGLRRGEICALTLADLRGNILYINKDMIHDEHNNLMIKESAKTEESNREIAIPEALANEIREKGYIYRGGINTLNSHLHIVQDKLGIPRFNLHYLRHFSAAYMMKMGFSREQIREHHGWSKSTNVDEICYLYNLDPDEQKKNIADAYGKLF